MQIRPATEADRSNIIDLYKSSQAATQIPNPNFYPPESLDNELYSRDAIERYVAVIDKRIVGHGLIEHPNPLSVDLWKSVITEANPYLIELGGAFVDPSLSRRGIYSELLSYRLGIIRELGAIPVAATWNQNKHVQRQFLENGGNEVARQKIPAGVLCLFVFNRTGVNVDPIKVA